MPKCHVSLPKLKPSGGEINVEGPDIKGGKIHMPSIDTSLPGGAGGDVNVEGHAGKGKKIEMPKCHVSLPKLKTSGGEINIEGPDIKGGKINMPSIDTSLSGGGAGGDVDVEGHAGKGGKFEMPTFDVSLPKLKPSGGEINIEGPHIKGGKINMPFIDTSLSGGAGGDVNVEGHAGKGGKFEMQTFDVSLPKLKPSGSEINIEGPEIKGGKIHMPSIDISLPGGGAGGAVDVEGHGRKGRKFEMPKCDVSLPKLKSSGGKINVEGPEIKGGKIHMPSIDTSLPGGGAGGEVNVKGHAGKGRKFEMPKFDVSLPKLKPSGGKINIEGPDIKGGNIHMPSIDISMPVGGAGGDVDVEGHTRRGRKIEMPKLDVSLPKLKPSEGEINVEGPDIKGGKFHMPSIDTSLPGAKEGELDLGDDTKKGLRFQMPTVPMPKMKLTDHELKVGSDKKDIDISVPKLTHDSDGETKTTDKIRDLNVPEVTLGGNIKLPSVKIPTVDISAPKVDLDFTLSKGKGNDRENIELLKAEGGRPSPGASFDVPDVSKKMPKISLPKFGRKLKSGDKQLDSPDLPLDLDLERTSPSVETSKKDTEIIGTDAEMKIKAGAGEITKPEIRVEGPDVKVKSKLKFPKFKTPTPKAKLKDVEMGMPGYVDNKGKVRMPAVEISLPTANIPECEVLLPKTEVDVSEADIRGYEGSLKIPKMPTIDISVPKADLDVSLPRLKLHEPVDSFDLHINSSRGTVNFPHVKIPEVDISLPHGKTGDTDNNELEISLPDAKHDTSNADTEIKGKKLKISVPSLDISLPHGKTTQNDDPDLEFGLKGSKLKMPDITVPKIDVSLPHRSKEESHAPDLALEGGKLKMPTTDMSLPKIKSKDVVPELQPDVGKGKVMIPGIKLPTIDVSFPHGKTEDTDDLELGVCGKEGKFKVPDTKIPKADVSSQGQPESAEKTEVRGQGSNFQLPKITIPKVDISLPYGKSDDPQTSGSVEVEGGQSKMPDIKIPQVAISLLESRTGEFDTKEGESGGGRGKFTMSNIKIPKLDIRMSSDADMSDPSTDASLKDSHKEGKKLRMPNLDLELDLGFSRDRKKNKKKNEHSDTDLELAAPKEKIKGPKVKGSKFNIGMPKVKVSRLETNINKSGKTDAKFLKGGTDANLQADLQAPKIPELDFDIETARSDTNNSEEDKKQIGKVKIPKFGVPLPSLSSPEANIKSSQGKDHSINIDSEAENESPHVPRVKKAVFVMVNPQMENTASIDGEASAEIVDEKLKQPKIKMKPSFGKSRSNEKEKAIYCEDEVETEGKSKTGKLKLPKVTFSSGQRGSSDVTPSGSDDGTGLSLNGGKDEKSMFGKLKLPKVEFFSPYSKDASEEEEMETSLKLRKEPSGESKESKVEVRKISTIVSSKARTEMLAEREGSESPVPTVSAGFVSVTKSEEREETTWFKVPKVTLSPHSTGILNISPESSPKGSKSSLPCTSEEASGGFYVKMPSVEFLTREMPSEHLITKTEGTLTVVTKTTKYTERKSTSSKE
uniref:Periaxin n=1 Tax=Cyprinus carpio carpio TaxID=630221 RepID=A0A9J7ZYC0_CYPCA